MPGTILGARMSIKSQLCYNFVYSHTSIYSLKDNQLTIARAYRLSQPIKPIYSLNTYGTKN